MYRQPVPAASRDGAAVLDPHSSGTRTSSSGTPNCPDTAGLRLQEKPGGQPPAPREPAPGVISATGIASGRRLGANWHDLGRDGAIWGGMRRFGARFWGALGSIAKAPPALPPRSTSSSRRPAANSRRLQLLLPLLGTPARPAPRNK